MRRSTLLDDSGFAIAVAMGAIALVTVIVMAGYVLADNTAREAIRVSHETSAYQAAASALDQELSVFRKSNLVSGMSPSGYHYGTWAPINNTDAFNVTVRSLGNDEYEMVSVGRSRSTTETVKVRFQSFNLWDMNISGSQNDSNGAFGAQASFNGSSVIKGKLYIAGDLDWSANGAIADGPVFVQGGVFNKGSAASSLGSAEDSIDLYLDEDITGPGADNNNYGELKGGAPSITVPWPTSEDYTSYASAAQASGWYIDGDASLGSALEASANNNVQITQTPDPSTGGFLPGYTLKFVNDTDGDGVNDVYPILFVNGELTLTEDLLRYQGKGMVVCTGLMTVNGRLVPDTYDLDRMAASEPLDVETTHLRMPVMTSTNLIGLSSLTGVTYNDQTAGSDYGGKAYDWLIAAIWTRGTFTANGTAAQFRGSIIAENIIFDSTNIVLCTQTGLGELIEGTMLPELNNLNAQGDWRRI